MKGKVAAILGMSVSMAILVVTGVKPWVLLAAGACLAASAIFVLTRPTAGLRKPDEPV
jgi:uncharacterized membrane protein YbaN (DUF454 family)